MPETFPTRCPNCRTGFQVPASVAGKKIRCKNCQTVFVAAAAPPPGPAAARPAKPAAPAGETFKLADDAPPAGQARVVKKAVPPQPAPPTEDKVKRPYDEDEDTGPAEYAVIKGADEVPRCPFCAKELDPPDTKICLNCGYDLLERRRHDSRKVYDLTAGDWIMHHLPAVACVVAIGILVAVDVICLMNMSDWFAGSFLESDDMDPNTGKKKFYLPPGVCTLWIIVPSLFMIWKCGVFAVKRFFVNWRPPETIKK